MGLAQVILCLFLSYVTAQEIRRLGRIDVDQAGFSNVFDHGENVTDPTERFVLYFLTVQYEHTRS